VAAELSAYLVVVQYLRIVYNTILDRKLEASTKQKRTKERMKHLAAKLTQATTAASTALTLAAMQVYAQGQIGTINVPKGYALNVGGLINFALQVVMVIAALLVFFYLIWGGIEWITSGGEKGKTEAARNKITGAVVGLIILAASFAILQLILSFLGFSGGIQEVLNSNIRINNNN
jgi:hypothetical protein